MLRRSGWSQLVHSREHALPSFHPLCSNGGAVCCAISGPKEGITSPQPLSFILGRFQPGWGVPAAPDARALPVVLLLSTAAEAEEAADDFPDVETRAGAGGLARSGAAR